MKNMIKFVAGSSSIDEPEIVLPKENLTFILSSDSSVAYMKKVVEEREEFITDRFNVNVVGTLEVSINSTVDLSNEDVIVIHMMGSEGTAEIKDRLLGSKRQ
ncbi:MAG: hypothetical protein R2741_09540 [Methanolobus sp.]